MLHFDLILRTLHHQNVIQIDVGDDVDVVAVVRRGSKGFLHLKCRLSCEFFLQFTSHVCVNYSLLLKSLFFDDNSLLNDGIFMSSYRSMYFQPRVRGPDPQNGPHREGPTMEAVPRRLHHISKGCPLGPLRFCFHSLRWTFNIFMAFSVENNSVVW